MQVLKPGNCIRICRLDSVILIVNLIFASAYIPIQPLCLYSECLANDPDNSDIIVFVPQLFSIIIIIIIIILRSNPSIVYHSSSFVHRFQNIGSGFLTIQRTLFVRG
jgi:hypothetical protein